jgi:site-specific DNA recombinase
VTRRGQDRSLAEGLKRTVASNENAVSFYVRNSTEMQKDALTQLTQLEALGAWLAREPGRVLVREYVDEGVSGGVPFGERPAGRQLLNDARMGLFSEVWVYKLDRLGRDDIDPLILRRDLARLGVRVRALHDHVESDLEFAIRVAIAAEERRVTRRRTTDGMDRLVRNGHYTGGPCPLGYVAEGAKPGMRYVVDTRPFWGQVTAVEVVRLIYRRSAIDGWSCAKIARDLNRLGVPTPASREGVGVRRKTTAGVWRAGAVRVLLQRRCYAGEREYGLRSKDGREPCKGSMPALIDRELWDGAQRTISSHRISAVTNRQRQYLLRSLIRCGLCGMHLSGSWQERDQRIWYRCNSKQVRAGTGQSPCGCKNVDGDFLEVAVLEDIAAWLRQPGELLDELRIECDQEAQRAVVESDRVVLEAALEELRSRRLRTLDLLARNFMTEEEFAVMDATMAEERVHVQERLTQLDAGPAPSSAEPDVDLLDAIHERLERGLTPQEQFALVGLLVKEIVAHTEFDEAGRKRLRLSIEYRFPGVVAHTMGTRAGRNYTTATRVLVL